MICEALAKSFDTFLRFLDCPEVPSESEAISEQWNAIVVYYSQKLDLKKTIIASFLDSLYFCKSSFWPQHAVSLFCQQKKIRKMFSISQLVRNSEKTQSLKWSTKYSGQA